MLFVNVIFNVNTNKTYCYRVPDDLAKDVLAGKRVYASFGNRELTGVITDISENPSYADSKDIIDILDEYPLISNEMLILTRWLADYYMSGWGQAIQLVLPKGLDEFSKQLISPRENIDIN